MLGVANELVVNTDGLTAVDLFSGAGGSTRGLTDAGFNVIGAIEHDEAAANTLSYNHPDVKVETDDIVQVSPKGFRQQLGLDRYELTLLTACPPCQGFSSLGLRDADDKRNALINQVWRFAEEPGNTSGCPARVPNLGPCPARDRASASGLASGNKSACNRTRPHLTSTFLRRGT